MRSTARNILVALLISAPILGTRLPPATAESSEAGEREEPQQVRLRGELVKIERTTEDKSHVAFNIALKMELTNIGAEPIILLLHKPWLGSEQLSRTPEDAANHKYVYVSGHWPSFYRAPGNEWEQLQHKLDRPSPPADRTIILYHGGSWIFETNTALYFEREGSIKHYKPDGSFYQDRQPWDVIRQVQPLWLQVAFEMWPRNVEPRVDPEHLDFGSKLQRRWRRDGKLWLENLKSEPIRIDLKDAGMSAGQ